MVAPQVVKREWVATAHAGVHGSGGATTPFTEGQAPSPAQQTLRKQGRLRSACSKRTQQWKHNGHTHGQIQAQLTDQHHSRSR
eukprot:COSAG06_NODE_16079_length_1023_cov_104.072511_2_plen_83_part_00